jgi:aryl-alcohol dehydrogenase-like predicted oxidoreductase
VGRRGDWLEAIEDLKREGKIRFFDVSMNDHQPANAVKLIEAGVVDTVQVIYNVFDQSPEDEHFPACQDNDVGLIVRVPFDKGALTGGSRRRSPSRTAISTTTTSAATASRKFMNGCGPSSPSWA